MTDLSTFGLVESPQGPPEPPAPCTTTNPVAELLKILSREDGLTCTFVGPVPIRNWPLVVSTCDESREKYPGDHVLLNSNGSQDRKATLWVVRRVLN